MSVQSITEVQLPVAMIDMLDREFGEQHDYDEEREVYACQLAMYERFNNITNSTKEGATT